MIVVPTIIVQIVAIYVFFYTYVDNINKHMARGVLSEMIFIKDSLNNKDNIKLINFFAKSVNLKFYFQKNGKIKKQTKTIKQTLRNNSVLNFFNIMPIIDPLNRFKIELESLGFSNFFVGLYDDNFLVTELQINGGILKFYIPKKRITNSAKYVFALWLILTSFLTSLVSIIFLKNQIKSIKGLSIAAEKFGRGQDAFDFKPSGPKEIKLVGVSFIKMKERIMRQITQRTQMLSAVSHDLRTPLTRMKLQLEMMSKEDSITNLKSDIHDMEKMINEYIDFTKSSGIKREKSKIIKIKGFLQKIVTYYQEMDYKISYNVDFDENLEISLKTNSLKRAIRNLIDNSFHYGSLVVLTSQINKNNLQITIDDNGCGIPKEKRGDIFKPFYRIDNSRNLDKTSNHSGAGLGLAIVMDVVISHGGKIEVGDSYLGGLKISIYLPI